jgi:D-serine deaminase-like pyridoxal phosphate-dependent protein
MANITDLWTYYKEIIKNETYPCLILDLDLFKENISNIVKRLQDNTNDDKKIRIASKSVRSISVLNKILELNDIYQGILSYSVREAIFLSDNGFKDIVVAYPSVNTKDISNLCLKIAKGADITLMVDSIDQVKIIQKIASENNVTIKVCLDIDLSTKFFVLHFGVRRSPIHDVKSCQIVSDEIKQSKNTLLVGIMGYEAQIAGVPDKSPAKNFILNFVIRKLKKSSLKTILTRREKIVKFLTNQGFILHFINGGGTGSVESTVKENIVTEVTVGSGFYSPRLFDYYNAFKHRPSLIYALEVTRIPAKNIYTCHGGGYVASGSLGIDKIPQPYLPNHSKLLVNEMAGEVQTPIENKKFQLKIGDPVFMRHSKAGELCEHFNDIIVVSKGVIVDRVKTYRGEGFIFL